MWEEPSPGIKSSSQATGAPPLGRVCVSLGNSFVRGMFPCVIRNKMNTALCLSPSAGAEGRRVCPPRGRRAPHSDEAPPHKGGFSGQASARPSRSPTLFKLSDSTSSRREWMSRTQKGPSVA